MDLGSLKVGIYRNKDLVYGDEDDWAIFDPELHGSFVTAESRRLKGAPSPDGEYTACWAESERENFEGEVEPAGICLVDSNEVILTILIEGVTEAVPANDGTIAALAGRGDRFFVFDSTGERLLEEEFDSNAMTIAISPDGDHAAVATAAPDNAAHHYQARDGQYLGRTENIGTAVLGHLEFAKQDDTKVLKTYEIPPDSGMDVASERKEVIDIIPVKPQLDTTAMDGLAIVVGDEDTIFHHIPNEELDGDGPVRLPGVELESACGEIIEPVEAALNCDDFSEAVKGDHHLCGDCQATGAIYPEEKVERTFDDL